MKDKLRVTEDGSEIAVVILAAGESRRYGSPKQLADWYGEPLLLTVIKQVESCGYLPYVALGAHREQIVKNEYLAPYRAQFIEVANWCCGIAASISASIRFLQVKPVTGVLFLLGDQPLIGAEHIRRLLHLAEASPEQTCCTAYKGDKSEFGVPAYFSRTSFQKLLMLQADQGAKWLLRSEQPRIVSIESTLLPEESLIDIDQPEDLLRAKSSLLLE